jgi:hypothetical protein
MRNYNYLTKLFVLLAAIGLIAVTIIACGGDDDSGPADSGPTGVVGGSGGSTSVTGKGGTTGGGTAGAAGSSSTCEKETTCGSGPCSTATLTSGLGMFSAFVCAKACCTADNKCGTSLSGTGMAATFFSGGACNEQNQAGKEDTNCPNLGGTQDAGTTTTNPIAGIFNYKGCCRPDGKCGLMITTLGLGCIANEDVGNIFGAALTGMAGAAVSPKACTY